MHAIWIFIIDFFTCELSTFSKVLSPLQLLVIYAARWTRVEAIQLRQRRDIQYGHSDYGFPDLPYRRGISLYNVQCLWSAKLTLPWVLKLPVIRLPQ